jgi:hypothetical protein
MEIIGTVPNWCTAVTALVSLKYLIDYAKAARDQVRISERQIEISQQQIKISQEQIRVSQIQVDITERHNREQMRPILVMTSVTRLDGNKSQFTIQNQGGGAAFDIRWELAGENVATYGQFGSQTFVLGPGAEFSAAIETKAEVQLKFVYFSTFADEHRSEVSIRGGFFGTRYYPNATDDIEQVRPQ